MSEIHNAESRRFASVYLESWLTKSKVYTSLHHLIYLLEFPDDEVFSLIGAISNCGRYFTNFVFLRHILVCMYTFKKADCICVDREFTIHMHSRLDSNSNFGNENKAVV